VSQLAKFDPLLSMILTSYLNGLWQIRLPLLAFSRAIQNEAIRIKGSDSGF
jgi:hypothetical protein